MSEQIRDSHHSSVFLGGEADAYYDRNGTIGEEIATLRASLARLVLRTHENSINKILELGSSDGKNLETLCDTFGAEGSGIDPSPKAVSEGNKRFELSKKPIALSLGVAEDLSFPANEFDLVWLGFFLYIEDRRSLLRTLTKADEVLKPGGFLAVHDFEPEFASAHPYRHNVNVRTYKNNYARFFTSLNHYLEIARFPLTGSGEVGFEFEGSRRESLTFLWKKLEPYPAIS